MSSKIASNATLKTGCLAKRARKRGMFSFTHWDDRLVSLHPTVIRYALPTGEVKGTFDLSDTATVESVEIDKKLYAFRVHNGSEEFYLSCDTATNRDEWMEAIRCAIAGDTVSLSRRGATSNAPLSDAEVLQASRQKVVDHALQQAADRVEEKEALHAWGSGRGRTLSSAVAEAQLAYINSSLVAIGKLSHEDLVLLQDTQYGPAPLCSVEYQWEGLPAAATRSVPQSTHRTSMAHNRPIHPYTHYVIDTVYLLRTKELVGYR